MGSLRQATSRAAPFPCSGRPGPVIFLRVLIWFSAACLVLAAALWGAPELFLGMVRAGGDSAQMAPAAGYLAVVGLVAAVSEHHALRV